MPKISVIVPVYNCAAYLERCLDSLAAQTFTDIEFILINDGSTDGGEAILRRYAQTDRRFVLISQENQGLSGARNTGLDAATGDYLGFVDADDFVEPELYETLLTHLLETGSDMAFCDYATTYRSHEELNHLGLHNAVIEISSMGLDLFYLKHILRNTIVCNKLYKRSLLSNHGIRFEPTFSEDELFHLRLIPHFTVVCSIGKTLYHYAQRQTSLTHSTQDITKQYILLLKAYLDGKTADDHFDRGPEFFFSVLYTNILFSPYNAQKDVSYFRAAIARFRSWDAFPNYCKKIVEGTDLQILYQSGAISRKFYAVQRVTFFLCLHQHDGLAARWMWFCSKLIQYKQRISEANPHNLFDYEECPVDA